MGDSYYKAQAELEIGQASNILQERLDAFNRELDMDGDWENYGTKWNKMQEQLKKDLAAGAVYGADGRELSFKTPLAQREIENMLGRVSVSQEARVLEKQQQRHKIHLMVGEQDLLSNKLKNYTPENLDRAGQDIAMSSAFMKMHNLMDEGQARNYEAQSADGALMAATQNAATAAFNAALASGASLEDAATYARDGIRGALGPKSISVMGTSYSANGTHFERADSLIQDMYTQFDDRANQYFEMALGNLPDNPAATLDQVNKELNGATMTWKSKEHWRRRFEEYFDVRDRPGGNAEKETKTLLGVFRIMAYNVGLGGSTLTPEHRALIGTTETSYTTASLLKMLEEKQGIIVKELGDEGAKAVNSIKDLILNKDQDRSMTVIDTWTKDMIKAGKINEADIVIWQEKGYKMLEEHEGGKSSPAAIRSVVEALTTEVNELSSKKKIGSMSGVFGGNAHQMTLLYEQGKVPDVAGDTQSQKNIDAYIANSMRDTAIALGVPEEELSMTRINGLTPTFTHIDEDGIKRQGRYTSYKGKNYMLIEEYDGQKRTAQYILDGTKRIDVIKDETGSWASTADIEAAARKKQQAVEKREADRKEKARAAEEKTAKDALMGKDIKGPGDVTLPAWEWKIKAEDVDAVIRQYEKTLSDPRGGGAQRAAIEADLKKKKAEKAEIEALYVNSPEWKKYTSVAR